MKAHRSKAECTTETERWTREGNEQADEQAKRGASKWGHWPQRALAAEGAHELAKQTAM